jgi:hypothetical protein
MPSMGTDTLSSKNRFGYFQTPSGQSLLLDADVFPKETADGEPLLHHGFASRDNGKTWTFDVKLRVPSQIHYASFLSDTDAYQLNDATVSAPNLFSAHDLARSWSSVDALKAVWQDEAEPTT